MRNMVVASRKVYEPMFKAVVLDEIEKADSVVEVARKQAAAAAKTGKGALKLVPPAGAEKAKGPKVDPTLHGDGPLITVHALGPWLRQVVRDELPGALGESLGKALDDRLGGALDELVDRKVGEALKAWVRKGVGT